MSIRIGQAAPRFAADAYVRGQAGPQRVTLDAYRGRWVVLFFYPRDFTFICPTEIQQFGALHDAFTAEQAVLLGASTDSFYSHEAWYESDRRLAAVTFPVLADTSHEVARAYGVLLEDGAALRGTFVLDPDGRVRHLQVNDLDVGRNPEETLRVPRALRTGELCPVGWTPGEATLSARAAAA
jgi:peroxiredoxin 2/4